jgi:carbon monoxide dehydrogenase subunit G
MIRFDGSEAFPGPVGAVFARLTDAGFLAGTLPDAEVTVSTPDRAAWKLRPKLSFLSGTLDTELTVTDRVPDREARYAVHGKAIGAGSTTVAALRFEPAADGGTLVRWEAEITALTGLLKMVPKGLIQATAQKVIADVWAAVRAKV